MDLRNRLAALEDAADRRPVFDRQYAVDLEREILSRHLIPLPPLDGVDLDATARLWAEDGERAGFVLLDGTTATADELERRR